MSTDAGQNQARTEIGENIVIQNNKTDNLKHIESPKVDWLSQQQKEYI